MIYLERNAMNSYNNASRLLQQRAYTTLVLADALLYGMSINVSSLIRGDTPHHDGSSVDINQMYLNGEWLHVGKGSKNNSFFNNTQLIAKLKEWLWDKRWLSQFICPYYIIDQRFRSGISYNSQTGLGKLIKSHQNHIHITFVHK